MTGRWSWPTDVTLSSNHSFEVGTINSGSNQLGINIQCVIEGPGHGGSGYLIADGIHGSKNCLPVTHPSFKKYLLDAYSGPVHWGCYGKDRPN